MQRVDAPHDRVVFVDLADLQPRFAQVGVELFHRGAQGCDSLTVRSHLDVCHIGLRLHVFLHRRDVGLVHVLEDRVRPVGPGLACGALGVQVADLPTTGRLLAWVGEHDCPQPAGRRAVLVTPKDDFGGQHGSAKALHKPVKAPTSPQGHSTLPELFCDHLGRYRGFCELSFVKRLKNSQRVLAITDHPKNPAEYGPDLLQNRAVFVVDTQQSSLPELERIGQPLLTIRELSLCCGVAFEQRVDAVTNSWVIDQAVELCLELRVAAHELGEELVQPFVVGRVQDASGCADGHVDCVRRFDELTRPAGLLDEVQDRAGRYFLQPRAGSGHLACGG